MPCLECQQETNNPKFCSRSCSASYTNRFKPSKLGKHKCKNCGIPIKFNRRYCKKCSPHRTHNQDITLKDAIYIKHHRSSAFALVRLRARAVAKKLGWKQCSNCPYSKHIEIGHIKSIADFDESTLLSIINHPSNLIPLCPNCHWEHDNLSTAQG